MRTETFLKLTWGDVLKWITLIASIVATFTISQVKIAQLDEGRINNQARIMQLESRQNVTEAKVSGIESKLNQIGEDVKAIKEAVINSQFSDHD